MSEKIKLIMNMEFVTKHPNGSIITLKDRDGKLPPSSAADMEAAGFTLGEGYGNIDCTEDLPVKYLEALRDFFQQKIDERNQTDSTQTYNQKCNP